MALALAAGAAHLSQAADFNLGAHMKDAFKVFDAKRDHAENPWLQELTLNKYFNKILDREETDKERAKREARYAKYEKQKEMMAQQQARTNGGNGSRPESVKYFQQPVGIPLLALLVFPI